MYVLFLILFFLSFFVLAIGLIKPVLILRRSKNPTRLKMFFYWLLSAFTLIILFVISIPKENGKDVEIDSQPLNTCEVNLGVLKMDENAHTIGNKTEMTELLRLLNDSTCDIIGITYDWRGSYGNDIPMKIVYNKKEERLKSIIRSNNIFDDYTGVKEDVLRKFLENREKAFYKLSDYDDNIKYDYNDREQLPEAVGEKPLQSGWDGAVPIVKKYIKRNVNDASSVKFLEWSDIFASEGYWVVRCKFSGTNAFGGIVIENKLFYMRDNEVVMVKDMGY